VSDLKIISKLSEVEPTTILPSGDVVALTEFQESLIRAYEHEFEMIVGARYRPKPQQRLADRQAAADLTPLNYQGSQRKYLRWSRQYLNALKEKAEDDFGDVGQATFGREGYVHDQFTFEWFLIWAQSDEPLPNGFSRR
jgi:hypothetical protein